jgi:hypothetical protein
MREKEEVINKWRKKENGENWKEMYNKLEER